MPVRLAFKDFELDEDAFQLTRGGVPVVLQPKVLELLLYLAKHRRRVVSKDELFSSLWDGTVVTEASLNRAVSLARKALGDDTRNPWAIRTVRGRGLQFVATIRGAKSADRPLTVDRVPQGASRPGYQSVHTEAETQPGDGVVGEGTSTPILYLLMHADQPELGGQSWSLAGVDEVVITRGSRTRARLEGDVTRVLSITMHAARMSRRHARVVRSPAGWLLSDEDSRNGTRVHGQSIRRHQLAHGDVFECGHVLFRFESDVVAAGWQGSQASAWLSSTMPGMASLERGLRRVASTPLPILLTGESGTGKSYLARSVHRLSERDGPLITLDLARGDEPRETLSRALADAAHGTLLMERVDRIDADLAAMVAAQLEASPAARLISTSQVGFAALVERATPELVARLAGFRGALPPLRERPADIGALVRALGCARKPMSPEAVLALAAYRWPGNLHELDLVIRSATAVAGEKLRASDLPVEVVGDEREGPHRKRGPG